MTREDKTRGKIIRYAAICLPFCFSNACAKMLLGFENSAMVAQAKECSIFSYTDGAYM